MASTMLHLLLAHKIKPNGCGLYFHGSFAPDQFDSKREDKRAAKNANHFRNAPCMETALREFYARIDKDNPFHEGYFVHLICDMWWSKDVINKYFYEKDTEWYKLMKTEYRVFGNWARQTLPWVDEVHEKIEASPNDFVLPTPDPSSGETIRYKNTMLRKWKNDKADTIQKPPSNILTHELMDSYSDEIATRYHVWIAGVNR